VVEEEFGAYDFRSAMNDLQELKQTGTVEEYTSQFQALQFDITMHNPHYDDMFFTPKYVMGLKEEIRGTVEAQLPATVQKASITARIQQGVLERSKSKYSRTANHTKPYVPPKNDNKPPQHQSTLWRDRQLRDYRKADGPYFNCGEKFVLGHLEVCPRGTSPKLMQ
jgi:hypothetical protein